MSELTGQAPIHEIVKVTPELARELAQKAKGGVALAGYNRGVCALFGDAESDEFFERVCEVKGDVRRGRPLATFMGIDSLLSIADFDAIDPAARALIASPEDCIARFGSICFLRVPVRSEGVRRLPAWVLSQQGERHYLQNWDANGSGEFEILAREFQAAGVWCPGITSLNSSGEPEITDQEEGIAFCRARGVGYFIKGRSVAPIFQGSYPIIEFSDRGVILARYGNVPFEVLARLCDGQLQVKDGVKGTARDIQPYAHLAIGQMTPGQVRGEVIKVIENS